jgi:hypothetical protein
MNFLSPNIILATIALTALFIILLMCGYLIGKEILRRRQLSPGEITAEDNALYDETRVW